MSAKSKGEVLKGIFYGGLFRGLDYKTRTISGRTTDKGEFAYRPNETVTFSVGDLVLGSAPGEKNITPAHLAIEVGGNVKKIRNQKVTNIAWFLHRLGNDKDIEAGVTITDEIREAVNKYRYSINFDQSEERFTRHRNCVALFEELGTPPKTPAQARNILRRVIYGIKKMHDVKIPTRDGSYLMANIFRPIEEGKYPVVMSLGAYGKEFWTGCICGDEDFFKYEDLEDNHFEGKPLGDVPFFGGGPVQFPELASECFELANPVDWVPKGYIVIRVDERGVGKTPGQFEQFSLQEAKDYYDAIEWAAKQVWSNGNVGLWGASYYGMNQYNVAQLQPPSLKAMIATGADINSYRDYIYSGGGLYNHFNFIPHVACGEWQGVDWISIAMENPFDDPAIYGPEGKICISPDMSKVTVPFISGMGLEGTIHTRGSSEAYIQAASKHKKLIMISEPGVHTWTYAKTFLENDVAFFDYWLKGINNGVMNEPPVKTMVRTGWAGYYWQDESDWPIPRTVYTRYYLDASPSTWKGDGRRNDFMKLSSSLPAAAASRTYSAEVDREKEPAWSHGVSFVTEPLPEDMVIAGYIKLVVWVSSTSHDMQLHTYIRVMDENDVEVPYTVGNPGGNRYYPVAQGALKVSHRKLDPDRSTIYRPYHTHLKKDYQPLSPGEIVEAQVEIWPTTALIKKGHRIRLDVQPTSGNGMRIPLSDQGEAAYQKGASNTIYTRVDHPSYVQLPVIPAK